MKKRRKTESVGLYRVSSMDAFEKRAKAHRQATASLQLDFFSFPMEDFDHDLYREDEENDKETHLYYRGIQNSH